MALLRRHVTAQCDDAAWTDTEAFDRATRAELKPEKLADTLAFMFESRLPQHLTAYAANSRRCRKTMPIAGRPYQTLNGAP